jgi:hypothetical protein
MGRQVIDIPFPLAGSLSNRVYDFVQSYEIPAWQTSSAAANTYVSNSFTFGSLDQVTSLAQVFDQYRIAHIKVVLIPKLEVVDAVANNAGLFTSVIDYDDTNVLTSIGQALDYQNALTTRGTEVHVRTFVPHVAVASYSGAFTSFANETSPWIDCSSANVQHYGVKTAWTVTSAAMIYDAIVSFHIQLRNVR